jgi:hypothetical protein
MHNQRVLALSVLIGKTTGSFDAAALQGATPVAQQ